LNGLYFGGNRRTSSAEACDILVIGSGESGTYLAWTMAGEGHRTAVVERKLIGGSCPNIACLPSKNIIQSAKVRSFTRRAAEFGVDLEPAAINMKGVQAGPQPLGHEDADVTAGIVRLFADEGITLHRQTKVRSIEGESGRSVRVVAEGPDGELAIDGTDLLVAVGRTPNTGGIGLEQVGVRLTETGYIAVDEHLATTAAAVWAMGDCAGSPQFTHAPSTTSGWCTTT
jgi:pyruvate/2-oxoglutarate dehydrogenase complex dihydrolipoamide dehydrogenase (E3) component